MNAAVTPRSETMQAVIHRHYGPTDELAVGDVACPSPRRGEVLVQVRAASVHADIWHVVAGRPYAMRLFGSGLLKPKTVVPGTDLSGIVELVGEGVTRFAPGDEVFGEVSKGMQWKNGGSFAEYAAVPEAALVKKPASVSFEEAAAMSTSGLIALHNLQAGGLKRGSEVLINGAGGAVGLLAVQMARAEGATVTAVDRAEKLDLIRTMGANSVIDYQEKDVWKRSSKYDLILDVASTLDYRACKKILQESGKYVLIGHDHYGAVGTKWLGSLPHFFKMMAIAPFQKNLPKLGPGPNHPDLLETLRSYLETGQVRPVVDKVYALTQVTDALRYLQGGRARGHIVLRPAPPRVQV